MSTFRIPGLVGLAAAVVLAAAPAAAPAQTKTFKVTITSTQGYYIDGGDPGNGPGDQFGSIGDVTKNGDPAGSFSSSCVTASADVGQCQATISLDGRGTLQLAGEVRPQEQFNKLSVVGGTGEFKRVKGSARLKALTMDGSVQLATLNVKY